MPPGEPLPTVPTNYCEEIQMHGHSTFEPKNGFVKWLEARLPIFSFMHGSFVAYPTPQEPQLLVDLRRASCPSCWWRRSSPAWCWPCITRPNSTLAFNSVENIMRDVNWGWLLRYAHANGASMFFFAVYIHMFRGIYYGSYKAPREVLWILGVIIFLLMMATGFMGYVLPWGQMSFWGATVITNLFSAIPLVGDDITVWLWGGFSVDNPTLNRFFSLHYLLPFVIVGGGRPARLGAACRAARTIPSASTSRTSRRTPCPSPRMHDEGRASASRCS